MSIHDLLNKWIREAYLEVQKAKDNSDLYKRAQLESLIKRLKLIRDGK